MTGQPERIQWGFSSLGAPELSLRELSELRQQFGLDFLELRAVRGTVALPDYFRDHPGDVFAKPGEIRVLATDFRLSEATDEDVATFMRYIELAETWKAPYIRVFGGGKWGDAISPELLRHAAKTVEQCRDLMAARGACCEMLLETHSGFSSAKVCGRLNEFLERPLGILWDSHNTWKQAGESLEESWRSMGKWVQHIHYKDSVASSDAKDGYHYVVPGGGQFPTQELLQLLAREGYREGVSLEWEKLWHPDLPEVSEALMQFNMIGSRKGDARQGKA